MNKMAYFTIALIIIVLISVVGYWKYMTRPTIAITPATRIAKAYSLSYATLKTGAAYPEFTHTLSVGMSWATVIIPLEGTGYLIAKFSMPVLPDAHFTQDGSATYMYTNGELIPWSASLTYADDGSILGRIQLTNQDDKNDSLNVRLDPKSVINIDNVSQFNHLKTMPGFEKASYKESSI